MAKGVLDQDKHSTGLFSLGISVEFLQTMIVPYLEPQSWIRELLSEIWTWHTYV
jgi:hypothetical protein